MTCIRRISAVDEVFHDIQNKIKNCQYPIGHVFPPQKDLAREYGVGASTAREAISKLTMLGYLSAKQGVGTTVISNSSTSQISNLGQYIFLNSSEVAHFMEARLCLEKAAARSAARLATKDDFDKMSKCLKLQATAVEKLDYDLFSNCDKEFHLLIMEAGRNPLMIQFMGIIQPALFKFIEESTRLEKVISNSIIFHEKILKCLRERNGEMAQMVLVEHLWDVAKIVGANLGLNEGLKKLFKREGLR